MSFVVIGERNFLSLAICLSLFAAATDSRAEPKAPGQRSQQAPAPAAAQRSPVSPALDNTCQSGLFASPGSEQMSGRKVRPKRPVIEESCEPPEQAEILLNEVYLNQHTNSFDRVRVDGFSHRGDYTLCVGNECEAHLASLGEVAEVAATILGGWKEEIVQVLSPKLPHCARVAPGNSITVDQDALLEYMFASEAVRLAYAGTLHTLSKWSRVDVKYNGGHTFTFWVDEIKLQGAGGQPVITLSGPTHAKAGGPCA